MQNGFYRPPHKAVPALPPDLVFERLKIMGLKMKVALRAALVLAGLSLLGGAAVAAPQEVYPTRAGMGMHHGMSGDGMSGHGMSGHGMSGHGMSGHGMSGQMCGHCRWMCPMSKSHSGWLAQRRAQDAELERLMGAVDAAPPEKKAEALAVVVGKLVKERKAANNKMAAWYAKMSNARKQ